MKKFLICLILILVAYEVSISQLKWEIFGYSKQPRTWNYSLPISDSTFIIIGGCDLANSKIFNSTEIVNINTGSINIGPSMKNPRIWFNAHLTSDSNIVVIGGLTKFDNIMTKEIELFDRKNMSWKVIGEMLLPRAQFASTFINSDEIIIIGGREPSYATIADCEIFNIKTGKSRAIMSFPMTFSTGSVVVNSSGDILAYGGREGGINGNRTNKVYRYDTLKNNWIIHDYLTDPIQNITVLKLIDGRVINVAGCLKEFPLINSNVVELEDQGYFNHICNINYQRQWHSLTQLNNDSIIVVGGYDDNQESILDCEIIDIKNKTVKSGPKLNYYHDAGSMVTLWNEKGEKKTFVVGGKNQNLSQSTQVIEILEYNCYLSNVSINSDNIDSICYGYPIQISADRNYKFYKWSNGSTSKSITIDKEGTYGLEVVDSLGCKGFAKKTIYSYIDNKIFDIIDPPKDNILLFDSSHYPILYIKTIRIKNKTSIIRTLNDIRLHQNISFSIPQSQFPIIFQPYETKDILISYSPRIIGHEYDTLLITDTCTYIKVYLEGQSVKNYFWGDSRCNVPIELSTLSLNKIYKLFPNPAKDYIYIYFLSNNPLNDRIPITILDFFGNSKIFNYTIESYSYDLPTKEVVYLNKIKIDINDLNQGTYFVKMILNNKISTSFFIKR